MPAPLVIRDGKTKRQNEDLLHTFDIESKITEFPQNLEVIFSKGNAHEKLWNQVIKKYHYLSHNVTVGRCIKYLFFSNGQILGAISFSSPAWHLSDRDKILKVSQNSFEI